MDYQRMKEYHRAAARDHARRKKAKELGIELEEYLQTLTRGRPRKSAPNEDIPKRPRGRPRKNPME